jgi:hypothetical protein
VFWIPLLTRTTALFSAGILYSMFMEDPDAHLKRFREALEFAMTFYVEGFKRIFSTLFPSSYERQNRLFSSRIPPSQIFRDLHWLAFFKELLWTSVFWGGIIFSIVHFASRK